MHRSGRAGDHDGQYIRLRYSMQFIRGGQPHTIEMEVSVPVGASVEERDQLIREAEASMEQLYRQIEKRGAGRSQQPSEASRPQAAPVQAGSHPSSSATPVRTPAPPAAPSAQIAAQANARDTSQASVPPGKRETTETAVPARSSIGSEMPVTPSLSSTATGNIRLAEFIQIIKNWGLTPKDVMQLLQIPNLNNMNYRELLRQLEPLVAQQGKVVSGNTNSATRAPATPVPAATVARPSTPPVPSPASPANTVRDASVRSAPSSPPSMPAPPANATNRTSQPAPPKPAAPAPSPKPAAPSASPAPSLDGPANIPVYPLPSNTLREVPRSYKFDEEEDEEPEEAQGANSEDESGVSEVLANIKIDKLRENRGNAVVSPARLTVLHNLLDSQISDEQFQQLIEGLWNINSDKKLKQDQVEALISWAKEDYFDDEVRAVIAVLKG